MGLDDAERLVYFIEVDQGRAIKIGSSVAPRKRLVELRVGSAWEMRLLGSCVGGDDREKALHAELAVHRMRGEWFAPSAVVLEAVARCLAEPESVVGPAVIEAVVLEEVPLARLPRPRQRRPGAEWLVRAVRMWAEETVRATGEKEDSVGVADMMAMFDYWLVLSLSEEVRMGLARPTRAEVKWWTAQAVVGAGGWWDQRARAVRGVKFEM